MQYSDWIDSRYVMIENQTLQAELEKVHNTKSNFENPDWILELDSDRFRLRVAPDTCCKTVVYYCGTMAHPNNLFEQGCFQSAVNFFSRNKLIFLVFAVIISVVQLLALSTALLLLKKLRKKVIWEWNKGLSAAH